MEPSNEPDLRARLEAIESQIEATLGHLKAMEYVLRLAIATHSAPEVLLLALSNVEQNIRDSESASEDQRGALYYAALFQGMEVLRDQIVELTKTEPRQ